MTDLFETMPDAPRSRLWRRQVLGVGAGLVLSPLLGSAARAQTETYPARNVRITVSAAPGVAPDILARQIGQWLGDRLKQSFVIDNRAGGAGIIGNIAAARAAPDGYTLLMVDPAVPITATLYPNSQFDFARDIAPVAAVAGIFYILAVHPSVPANNVEEFIDYAKKNPGKINVGSPMIGSASHVAGEMFKMMAGVNMVHVPYRGGGGMFADLVAGQVQATFATTVSGLQHVKSGKLRALGVTSANRWDRMPDLPTIGEVVAGYEATSLYGIGSPKDTPVHVIAILNAAINDALREPQARERISEAGGLPLGGSPEQFGTMMTQAIEKWAKVIRDASIKPE